MSVDNQCVNAVDVAKYVLLKTGPVTTIKLQKLVYYSQVWSLVWDEQPLFNDEIQAWVNGPVIPALFFQHKGQFMVDDIATGDDSKLNQDQKDTIDAVVKAYGIYKGQQLVDMTHSEAPWKDAREGYRDNEICQEVISIQSMYAYYSSL